MSLKPKRVSFTLTEDVVQAIDLYANAQGKDRTTVVVQALQQMFGLQLNELSSAVPAISKIEQEIEQLHEISELKARMGELEKKVADLTAQLAELSQPKLLDNTSIQHITAISEHLINLITQPQIFVQQIEEVKSQTTDVLSSQYVQIDNFLSQEERTRLLNYVLQQESAFVPTSTSTNDLNYRRSMVLHSFPEFSEMISDRIQAIMPNVFSNLGLPSFSVSQIEAQLTAHNDGNYYKIHNDNGSSETANREFTYVYYFYREPKPFSGGELLIYDSKIENNFYVAAESFQTVEPRNNSIVFFLSRYLHEVLPVKCPSKTFADSRFTINGWVRR